MKKNITTNRGLPSSSDAYLQVQVADRRRRLLRPLALALGRSNEIQTLLVTGTDYTLSLQLSSEKVGQGWVPGVCNSLLRIWDLKICLHSNFIWGGFRDQNSRLSIQACITYGELIISRTLPTLTSCQPPQCMYILPLP